MGHRRRRNPFTRKSETSRRFPNITRGQNRPPRVPRDPVFRVRGLINMGVRDTNVPNYRVPRSRRRFGKPPGRFARRVR